MSRTLKQLDLGTPVMIQESGVDVEYILIGKDSSSCQMLRTKPVQAKRMNATDVAVYTDCEMDVWLCDATDGFLNRFDAATQSALVSRSISTYSYGDADCTYISRKCYLLSYGALFGNGPTATEPDTEVLGALMAYTNKADGSGARIAYNDSGSAVSWWLRSPNSAARFRSVLNSGNANYNDASGTSLWCRPVLSVASATIVSDEGAGIIHLLPVVGHREVEFRGRAGTSSARPRKCCVKYTAIGLSNVQVKVTNNYGDAEPVWVDATAGTDVEFLNTAKQTDQWQIGISCYGETDSYNPGYFKEPTILVEV